MEQRVGVDGAATPDGVGYPFGAGLLALSHMSVPMASRATEPMAMVGL